MTKEENYGSLNSFLNIYFLYINNTTQSNLSQSKAVAMTHFKTRDLGDFCGECWEISGGLPVAVDLHSNNGQW